MLLNHIIMEDYREDVYRALTNIRWPERSERKYVSYIRGKKGYHEVLVRTRKYISFNAISSIVLSFRVIVNLHFKHEVVDVFC